MGYRIEGGWFREVNGHDVVRDVVDYSTTTWTRGHPIGILWHYTAGTNDNIAGTLRAKGFGAQFNVGRNGVIYQYTQVYRASWHAFDASRFYVGIEHTAHPPQNVDLTDVQLEASAALSAAIVEWTERRFGFMIPIRKLDPPVTTSNFTPGFLDHRDGDSSWNRNGHTDHLYYWSWRRYLGAVTENLVADTTSEDDMAFDDFKNGWKAFRAGKALAQDKSQDWKWGWLQARWASTQPQPPAPTPVEELPPHTHPHTHVVEGTAT